MRNGEGELASVPVTTPRLLLRPWTMADAGAAETVFGDPEVMRWYADRTPWRGEALQRRISDFIEHERKHGFSPWAAVLREGNRLIGHCGLEVCTDTHETEVCFALARDVWGRGLATEGARAVLQYGFETLGLDRIAGTVYPQNTTSVRLLQRLGMRFDRVFRQYGCDLEVYVMDRSAFAAMQ